ncbi:hypothetical protein F5148DRAFT_880314 [Russula earlei]|uniref:Uncharacterized protein n=2 Tax=Russula earlei TaxID=71964 RepID=A0ACC0TUF1_9AGAM|nr:hypothetical protein F5148DRAFT_629465 [Russula earlei]KAI9508565.1 hypothetical protein F5148DRAFT_880314 [Russula earlei]
MRMPKRQDDNDNDQHHSTPNPSREQLLAGWKRGARGREMGDERRDEDGGDADDQTTTTTRGRRGGEGRGNNESEDEDQTTPMTTEGARRREGEGEGEGRRRDHGPAPAPATASHCSRGAGRQRDGEDQHDGGQEPHPSPSPTTGEARPSTPPSAMRALAHSAGGGCYWATTSGETSTRTTTEDECGEHYQRHTRPRQHSTPHCRCK